MKTLLGKVVVKLMFFWVLMLVVCQYAGAQVFDPNDPIVVYNPSAPPSLPAGNTVGKWVKSQRLGWNTSSFKCYYYNGIAFRLKYPKTYTTDAPGTKYPLLLFFHGVGEKGTIYDNEFQLFHGGQTHSNAVDNGSFNGFLLYPQTSSASGGWSDGQLDVLANLIRNFLVPQVNVDPFRIMVNGLSGGGGATWNFMMRNKTLTAASLPMSGSAIQHRDNIPEVIYNSFWISNGGLDNAPSPYTVNQIINAASTQGANYKHNFFPNLGHGVWNDFWALPDYFPFLRNAHKANPWPRYGRTEFCPGDNINVTIGVTPGFAGYQWRRNGVNLAGTGNTIQAVDTGTYECRIQYNGEWSVWSPTPVKIVYKAATVSPNINVSGLASNVLPSLDGKTSVDLEVPTGYTSYVWQTLNPTTTLSSTSNKLTGVGVGSYQVRVSEQYGCSSSFSEIFNVVSASGPNAPPAASNLSAQALSQTQVRVKWDLQAPSGNVETAFEIYQALANDGPYQLIGFANTRVDSFIVNNLQPNVRYFYKVRAINATAGSSASAVASALTLSDNIKPTPPANLRSGMISQSSVELVWEASTDDAAIKNYDLYVNGIVAYTIPGDKTTFNVYNLTTGVVNNFVLVARDLAGNLSSPSNQVTAIAAFSGLNYKHYTFTGTWNNLPNFATLTPVATGNMPNVSITNRVQDDNFAYLWEGFIKIPVTGSYTFRTSSDDGSKLYLGNLGSTASPYGFSATALVNNDGLHGTQSVDGTRTLTAGVYPIAITFYEQGGGEVMEVSWRTPQSGGSFISIPNSAFVQEVSAPGSVPAAPSNLVATAASAKKINLSWNDNSNNETAFELYRSTSNAGPFNIFATVAAGTTSYKDSSLEASTTYYYRVKAINNNGGSAFDKAAQLAVQYNYYEINNLSVLPDFNTRTPKKTGRSNNFDISTRDRNDNFQYKFSSYITISEANTYTFYTTSDDGSKLYIGTFNNAGTVVNNDGLHGAVEASGTIYLTPGVYPIFVTFFERDGGETLEVRYSSSTITKQLIPNAVLGEPLVNATTLALPALPAAPINLTTSAVNPTSVTLSWTNQAAPATVSNYEVWHSLNNNANYELVKTVAPNSQSYTDVNLQPNTSYFFKVRAQNEGGFSAYSNEISVTTPVAPVTVVSLPAITNKDLKNDSVAIYNLAATSDLGTTITYTSTNLPSFATISTTSATTASLTINPGIDHLGTYSATIVATDNFGGTDSKTFSILVTGKNATTINVNFNQTLPQAAPWNNFNSAPTNGATVGSLKDLSGATTTTSVTLLNAFTGTYSNGVTTGNNSGVFPDNVLRSIYFGSNTSPYQFRVSGLSPNKKYSFIMHAGYPWTAAQQAQSGSLITNYAAGGKTVSLDAANNVQNTVRLNGLTADASGNIVVSLTKAAGAGFCIINGMQIIAYDGPNSVYVFNPPTNLKGNGISATQTRLNWQAEDGQTRTGFEIWRSSTPNGTYTLRSTVANNIRTFTDDGLATASTYFYKVRSVNNGVYSEFTPYVGASTVTYTVNLNLNSQAAISEAAPWNNLNTLTYGGYTFENMVNMQNQSTGINFNVLRNFTSFHDGFGMNTGNNSGAVPDNVMRTVYYVAAGDTANFTISGLNRSHLYNFVFFAGSSFGYSSVSQFWVGSDRVSIEGMNNTSNTVSINALKPDSTGTISIWFTTTSMYAFINSISVNGMVSPESLEQQLDGNQLITQGRFSSGNETTELNKLEEVLSANNTRSSQLVNELKSTNIEAYPNPFKNNINVRVGFTKDVSKFTLVVRDATGRNILINNYANVRSGIWQQSLSLGDKLAPGVYFVQIAGIDGEKPRTVQIVKH